MINPNVTIPAGYALTSNGMLIPDGTAVKSTPRGAAAKVTQQQTGRTNHEMVNFFHEKNDSFELADRQLDEQIAPIQDRFESQAKNEIAQEKAAEAAAKKQAEAAAEAAKQKAEAEAIQNKVGEIIDREKKQAPTPPAAGMADAAPVSAPSTPPPAATEAVADKVDDAAKAVKEEVKSAGATAVKEGADDAVKGAAEAVADKVDDAAKEAAKTPLLQRFKNASGGKKAAIIAGITAAVVAVTYAGKKIYDHFQDKKEMEQEMGTTQA